MTKKKKKSPQNRQNAAGNSRISVLTEDGDTYNPFKDIKESDVVTKVTKNTKPVNKNNVKKSNEPIVEDMEDVSFAQVFEQWENGGLVNNKKQNLKNNKSEDFATIFDEWEVSQGLKPKYGKKAKDSPDRKASNYAPTKDFGDILSDFENGPKPKKKKDKKQKFDKNNKNIVNDVKTEEVKKIDNEVKPLETKEVDKSKDDINVAWRANESKDKSYSKTDEVKDNSQYSKQNKKYDKKNKWKPQEKDENLKKSKWDFSDIYNSWEAVHDDSQSIEAKKIAEKKESKGISISYLRSMSPEAELDLHGETSDIAALKVSEFLNASRNRGLKKVSIITGKGIHSENGKPVIKEIVLEEIRSSNIVREAYHPKAINGGSGAIWIIFKSISEKKIYF
eukprot:Anaeramoba_ignava/a217859_18.p1 GENE.a217859_18~~a217859_18.p1  ORF type:complete len:392 (-),score=64.01 a217859_18:378-1553(-)